MITQTGPTVGLNEQSRERYRTNSEPYRTNSEPYRTNSESHRLDTESYVLDSESYGFASSRLTRGRLGVGRDPLAR